MSTYFFGPQIDWGFFICLFLHTKTNTSRLRLASCSLQYVGDVCTLVSISALEGIFLNVTSCNAVIYFVKRMSLSPHEMQWYIGTRNTHRLISFQDLYSVTESFYDLKLFWCSTLMDFLAVVSKLLPVYVTKCRRNIKWKYICSRFICGGFGLSCWGLEIICWLLQLLCFNV